MADTGGMTLDNLGNEETLTALFPMLSEEAKNSAQIAENTERTADTAEKQKAWFEDPTGLFNAKSKRQAKKDRITDNMLRWVVVGEWFKNSLGFLKDAAKAAGGWIVDLLKFLVFFAMFGEGFLESLINWIISIFMMVAQMLITAIPIAFNALAKLIPTLVNIFIKMLPVVMKMLKVLFKILFHDIAPALGKAFAMVIGALAEEFKDVPVIGQLLKFMNFMIGSSAALQKVIGSLIVVGLILGKLGLLGPLFSGLGAVIGALSAPVLAVIAAIAALVAIFVFAEEIVSWFDNSFDKFFEKMGTFGTILKFLLYFALPIIPLFRGLATIFKNLKEILKQVDWGKTLNSIENFINSAIDGIMKIPDIFNSIVDPIINGITQVHETIKGVVGKIIDDVVSVFNFGATLIQNAVSAVINTVIKTLLKGVQVIFNPPTLLEMFYSIIDAAENAFEAISNIISKIMNIAVIKKISKFFNSMIDPLISWFPKMAKALFEMFQKFAKKIASFFAGDNLMKSITELFNKVVKTFTESPLFAKVGATIKELVIKIKQVMDNVIGSIVGFVWNMTNLGSKSKMGEVGKVIQFARASGEKVDDMAVADAYELARKGKRDEATKALKERGASDKLIAELVKLANIANSDAKDSVELMKKIADKDIVVEQEREKIIVTTM